MRLPISLPDDPVSLPTSTKEYPTMTTHTSNTQPPEPAQDSAGPPSVTDDLPPPYAPIPDGLLIFEVDIDDVVVDVLASAAMVDAEAERVD